MITARYEPALFPSDRISSTHLGTPRRGCTPQVSSSSTTTTTSDSDDIDRFMDLAHAALEEEATKEEAKGVLQELVERLVARTGAPLMAGVIAEQLRSQEVIERLAEQSFERQRRKQRYSSSFTTITPLSTKQKRRKTKVATVHHESILRPLSSPIQTTESPPSSSSSTSSSSSSSTSSLNSLEDAVTRDQFIIQHPTTTLYHNGPDRLLLVSDYLWRLFRLLILASLVALVYHYICTYPPQSFL